MDYVIPIIIVVLIFSSKLFKEVKDYLLKKEQIKANTELRAEALRLKNILELDKFIENSNYKANQNANTDLNNDKRDIIRRTNI